MNANATENQVTTKQDKKHMMFGCSIIAVIAAAVIGIIIWACRTPEPPLDTQETYTMQTIWQEYFRQHANKLDYRADRAYDDYSAAEAKYQGKRHLLTGEVEIIHIDEKTGAPYVTFAKTGYDEVTAYFGKSDKKALSKIAPGQTITFTGKINVFETSNLYGQIPNFHIEECRLKK
jgi:hypothetical protein